MDEYITKEAAIEVFEWGDADVIEDYGDGCDFGFSRGAIKSAINAIPTADVAPVVHGVWACVNKIDPISGYRCSKCRHIVGFDLTPYCPNCGAKMDGGDIDAAD